MKEIKLETERLILRFPKIKDWEDIVEWAGEYDVSKMTEHIPYPYKKQDAIHWITETIKSCKKNDESKYVFYIELKSEKKVIGCLSLTDLNKFSGTATTGSWINKKYWRMGYMTEAKIVVNDFAFNKLKLRRLNSAVFKDNKASNATQLKMGYKLEGTKRKSAKSRASGKIHDENIYGLLKKDWQKIRPKFSNY